MAKRPTPPNPEKDEAMRTERTETTVPVNVGMDADAMAVAETQNRQVGVDDSPAIRETLHDAAEQQAKTVDIPVTLDGGEDLPAAAQDAIAAKGAPARSGNTLGAFPGGAPDPYGDDVIREATVNGRHYTWRKGQERTVPAEAVEVWERMKEANQP